MGGAHGVGKDTQHDYLALTTRHRRDGFQGDMLVARVALAGLGPPWLTLDNDK